MRKIWPIVVGVLVVAIVAAIWRDCIYEPPVPAPSRDAGTQTPDAADVGPDVAEEPATQPWLVAEPRAGSFVALLNGDPVEAEFKVGAAGVYPPLETRGSGIALPQPAFTMRGEPLDTIEVYAATPDRAHSFWGDVVVDANAIELQRSEQVVVRVMEAGGAPLAGASVRLARDVVGLVLRHAQTDDAGVATFDAVPAGEYVAMAEGGGGAIAPSAVTAGGETTLIATRGSEVHGTVTGPRGRPVSGAVVAVFGRELGAAAFPDLPADIVKTDDRGEYRATGVGGASFLATVVSERFAPSRATAEAMPAEPATQLDVQLGAGHRVVASVTSQGEPVGRAHVRWVDESTGAGATSMSDDAGQVRFVGVPRTAIVSARFNHFESGTVRLDSLQDGPPFDVNLPLESSDARIWRYRVEVPQDMRLYELKIFDDAGVHCDVLTQDQRDFTARGCGEGAAHFEATTDLGVARWSADTFEDGATVELPAPTSVTLNVNGAADEPWADTVFQVTGTNGLNVPFELRESSDGRVVETQAYPGSWTLHVSNRRIGSVEFALPVTDQPLRMTLKLVALHTFRLHAVDQYGAAVTGAYAMLFADDGTLVDVSRTAGQLPLEFRVRPPFNGKLLVVDPRRGEGVATLQTSGEAPERVELDDPVLTHRVPASRPTPDELAARTGAKLVERDEGWLLDFERATAATRAGLRRGDTVVSAWKASSGLHIVVKRRGEGYVDVIVP